MDDDNIGKFDCDNVGDYCECTCLEVIERLENIDTEEDFDLQNIPIENKEFDYTNDYPIAYKDCHGLRCRWDYDYDDTGYFCRSCIGLDYFTSW